MTNDQVSMDQFDSFEDYCAALRRLEWLTPRQYYSLLTEELAYGEESYGEHYTQYRSECDRFGDAGPGQGLRLHELSSMLSDTRAKIARVNRIIANLTA